MRVSMQNVRARSGRIGMDRRDLVSTAPSIERANLG